jgi:hypothetical protein
MLQSGSETLPPACSLQLYVCLRCHHLQSERDPVKHLASHLEPLFDRLLWLLGKGLI